MKKVNLAIGIALIVLALPSLLLNVFMGILLLVLGVVMIVSARKKEQPAAVHYLYDSRKIYDQDQEWNDIFYKEHLDELIENEDFHLPDSQLKESYEGERVYKYEEKSYLCDVKGLEVFYGDKLVGTIKQPLETYLSASIVLCGGKYKYVSEDIDVDSADPFFYLEIKKRTA